MQNRPLENCTSGGLQMNLISATRHCVTHLVLMIINNNNNSNNNNNNNKSFVLVFYCIAVEIVLIRFVYIYLKF